MNLSPLIGGLLVGAAAAMLFILHGQIAGVSGILGGALSRATIGRSWRLLFLAGLVVGGGVMAIVRPSAFASAHAPSPAVLIVAGLLVGFGTRLGDGCTSGHGVCGIGRLSERSIVATLAFIAAGAAAVYVARHVIGGGM